MALITALMALSLGAFAAPAMGAPGVWTKNGAPIQGSVAIELSGVLKFGSFGGQASCGMVANATLEPGGKGGITAVELSNCVHPEVPCEQGATNVTVPWAITPEWVGGSARVAVDDIAATVGFASPCNPNFQMLYASDGELDATPSNPGNIQALNLSGWWSGTDWWGTGTKAGMAADLAVTGPGGKFIQVGIE
ncbi:MAG TPA: hypothetical protein VNP96_05925 [Solirubrobacterales bacterium]|nr:hypothetical protein [Solirubrobacterales bacterium]